MTQNVMMSAFRDTNVQIRVQLPLALGEWDEPEPDLAVVPGDARDYLSSHPQTAILVVEVADSSLAIDRTAKTAQYARAGILDYWIVNLVNRCLEVHREPSLAGEQPLGPHYGTVLTRTAGETISPLGAPDSAIKVSDLLP